MGIKAVFEYGEKGKSNRDDWLPQLPTVAMAFRDANYSTLHSGKWHAGGMRNDDLDLRLLPFIDNEKVGGERRCPHPGPNQQGFQEYVSVLDGPGAPRQNHLQIEDKLYSHGCEYLLRNDKPIGKSDFRADIQSGTLSHCEASHAMRMMNDSVAQNKPFYMHVWFHAPHGPWQEIPGYAHLYEDQRQPAKGESKPCSLNPNDKIPRFCHMPSGNSAPRRVMDRGMSRFTKYRSMVSDMDHNVGRLLLNLRALGVDRDTLVVFLSDNGPEDGAGGTGGHRGNKRHIYEGGIRVPAIFQWVGTIPAGKAVSTFAVSTDLYPTFLDAAGIKPPSTARLDGMSLLPELTGRQSSHKYGRYHRALSERVTLWHNDFEGPRKTAAWTRDFKLLLDEKEVPRELFDMLADPAEQHNLLESVPVEKLQQFAAQSAQSNFAKGSSGVLGDLVPLSEHSLAVDRANPKVHLAILAKMFRVLHEFAKSGDEAYQLYFQRNPGRVYPLSITSDQRHVHGNLYRKVSAKTAAAARISMLLNGTCGSTPCSCDVPRGEDVPSLPFSEVPEQRQYLTPNRFLNGSRLLGL